MLKKLFDSILNIFYPLECVGCGRDGMILCDLCAAELNTIPSVLKKPTEHLDILIICANFRTSLLKTIIHNFKYNGITSLATPLAKLLYTALKAQRLSSQFAIMPIPLHWRKETVRGYNQTRLLAERVAASFGSPIDTGLKRIRFTPSQSKLTRTKRLHNLKNAFKYTGAEAPNTVVLIDDVATTYSTLESAASELKKKGCSTVVGIVCAKNDP